MSAFDDFSIIGSDEEPTPEARARAENEARAFSGNFDEDEDAQEYKRWRHDYHDYNKRVWDAHIDHLEQIRKLKDKYSRYVLKYLAIFSFCVLFIILCQAINPKFDLWCGKKGYTLFRFRLGGFHLDNSVLVSLVGGTSASAIGLVAIVLQGLFKAPKEEKSEEKSKPEGKKSS